MNGGATGIKDPTVFIGREGASELSFAPRAVGGGGWGAEGCNSYENCRFCLYFIVFTAHVVLHHCILRF